MPGPLSYNTTEGYTGRKAFAARDSAPGSSPKFPLPKNPKQTPQRTIRAPELHCQGFVGSPRKAAMVGEEPPAVHFHWLRFFIWMKEKVPRLVPV
ncbi:hypothetical protein E2320_000505 [Naja naja]|nr:hypothetical protein E2320_000505 [Naja naja]